MLADEGRVRHLLLGILEWLPLVVFAYSGRMEVALAERFFLGAAAALVTMPLLLLLRWRLNPLLLAVNIWLWLEALPFLISLPPLAEALAALRETAFFIAMLVVGAGYTALSPRGLFAAHHSDSGQVRRYSLLVLALVGLGLAVSIMFRGDEMLAAVLPAMAVFLTQMVLSARLRRHAAKA